MVRKAKRIAGAAVLAASAVLVPLLTSAAPASANGTCCIIVSEFPSPSNQEMLKDVWGNNGFLGIVPQSDGNDTTFQWVLPAVFGGNTYYIFQDSRGYCLTVAAPPAGQPPPLKTVACDSSASAQRFRWIATGQWHYLTNLHWAGTVEAADANFGCQMNGCDGYVIMDPHSDPIPWGVFYV